MARPHDPAVPHRLRASVAGGTDRTRLTKVFNALAEGGKIKGPLARQPWGGETGWLTDRFGINWTINIETAK